MESIFGKKINLKNLKKINVRGTIHADDSPFVLPNVSEGEYIKLDDNGLLANTRFYIGDLLVYVGNGYWKIIENPLKSNNYGSDCYGASSIYKTEKCIYCGKEKIKHVPCDSCGSDY
jgi:hypothetical protein